MRRLSWELLGPGYCTFTLSCVARSDLNSRPCLSRSGVTVTDCAPACGQARLTGTPAPGLSVQEPLAALTSQLLFAAVPLPGLIETWRAPPGCGAEGAAPPAQVTR